MLFGYRRMHCFKTYKWQIPPCFIVCTVHPNIFCFYKINSTELRGKNVLLQNAAGYLPLLVPLYLRYEWPVMKKPYKKRSKLADVTVPYCYKKQIHPADYPVTVMKFQNLPRPLTKMHFPQTFHSRPKFLKAVHPRSCLAKLQIYHGIWV